MLKIQISEINELSDAKNSAPTETVVYVQHFKELNVQQLVTSINKAPRRSRGKATVKPAQ